jgi:hypothetical protein
VRREIHYLMASRSKIRLDFILSKKDLKQIVSFTKNNKPRPALLYDTNVVMDGKVDVKKRDTLVYDYRYTEGYASLITAKFNRFVDDDTCQINQFDLLEYGEGMFFETHMDSQGKEGVNHNPSGRVWSSSTMIDCTDDLEGGDLILYGPRLGGTSRTIRLEKGQTVFFPSNYYHEVTPVIKGRRTVLVAWSGKPYEVSVKRNHEARGMESGRLTFL